MSIVCCTTQSPPALGGSLSIAGFAYSPQLQMSIGDVHHHRGCPRVVVLTPAQTSIDAYTLSETHIVGTVAAIAFYVGVLAQREDLDRACVSAAYSRDHIVW